jgi:carbonic anhydrase
MTPAQVIAALKQGNERFRTGTMTARDYRDQRRPIRRRSPILADRERNGAVQIVGAMYDLTTGTVEFLD